MYKGNNDKKKRLDLLKYKSKKGCEIWGMGAIDELNSNWNSSILLVLKLVCSCIDLCKVNTFLEFEAYPIPCVDELLDLFVAAHFYSILDLTKGYWQTPLTSKR